MLKSFSNGAEQRGNAKNSIQRSKARSEIIGSPSLYSFSFQFDKHFHHFRFDQLKQSNSLGFIIKYDSNHHKTSISIN